MDADDSRRRYRAEADEAAARIPDAGPQHSRLWVVLAGALDAAEARLRARGGRRLRSGIRLAWLVVGAAGVLLLVGPVIDPPLSLEDVTRSARTAADTWIAREFRADYRIDRDPRGRLIARVTERIDAFFPDGVDESGIERVLATDYEGHDLAARVDARASSGAPSSGADIRTPVREAVLAAARVREEPAGISA